MASSGKTMLRLAEVARGEVRTGSSDDGSHLITDVTHDSRQAGPGTLFVAVRGASADGHDFVEQALLAGSPAVCVDHAVRTSGTQLVVSDTRAALGPLSAEVHDHPSRSMAVVGVTGTNGKTTVTHYLESLATSGGTTVGLIGTICTKIAGQSVDSVHTTPEATDFQRLLARMRDAGADLVAAEVSSHALALGRVAGTKFAVAAFTNLSQDHLDFHGDMGSYRAAKQRLFREFEVGTAVVNTDDETGRKIAAEFQGRLLTVGAGAEVTHLEATAVRGGTEFTLSTPWGSERLLAPVVGVFNLDNATLASACALVTGMSFSDVVAGLGQLSGVPGRFENVSDDDPIRVVVDYAHTPAGIAQAISTGRDVASVGRVIALIGAGGDRDREKRPLMGQAASGADLVFITSDNPRSEDPESIARAVAAGVVDVDVVFDLDRASAIGKAIDAAVDGDIVLILGRGHEPFQDLAGKRVPFDDRVVAREALARRRSPEAGAGWGSMRP